MGNGTVVDTMIADGLWCAFDNCHMGMSGEHVADTYHVGREEQDRYAVESHRRAAHARREGWFKDEILPVSVPQKKGPPVLVDRDEPIREDTSESVARGAEAGVQEGRHGHRRQRARASTTPRPRWSSWPLTSPRRAASTPLARIVGQATSGLAPKLVMMTPVEAVRKVAAKVGWNLADVDLFEINEAFSVQLVAVMRELGVDPSKVNVNGGAVALGHPIGASGARVLTTLLYEMKRRDVHRGIAALCLGGGNGVALAVER